MYIHHIPQLLELCLHVFTNLANWGIMGHSWGIDGLGHPGHPTKIESSKIRRVKGTDHIRQPQDQTSSTSGEALGKQETMGVYYRM